MNPSSRGESSVATAQTDLDLYKDWPIDAADGSCTSLYTVAAATETREETVSEDMMTYMANSVLGM